MSKKALALWRYDRTQALFDGRVTVAGHDFEFLDLPLEEIFSRAFDHGEFDASELSFSNFLRATAAGTCRYRGMPTFPSRSFRHGTFYIKEGGTVRRPEDLIGKRVGVREYSMTAALAARGALRDQFGIDTSRIHWIMGDVDHHERDVIPLPKLYRSIDIAVAPSGKFLSDMLVGGELEAVLAYKPLAVALDPASGVRRLFQDHARIEKEYYAQTGIFPVMHLVGLRADHEHDDGLARAIYDALVAAHDLAAQDLRAEQALKIMLPWLADEVKGTIATMGDDYWPNGLSANRSVLQRMIQWSFEDGLIAKPLDPDQLFLPSLRAT